MDTTFEHLLAAALPRVHRAALGFVHDEQEARELAQESLLKAHRARDRYDAARPFYPWLYRIVRNTCADALARRRHAAAPGLDAERVAAEAEAADDGLVAAQARRALARAMATLPEAQREILNLRHFQDLTYAEIGELLQVPEGTVMSRLYRARRALAEAMSAMEAP
jgi:RNA polymerase sigma-70 factor (ECF subfamily)